MTAAQLQTLLDDTNCTRCYAGPSVVQLVKLSLLDRVSKLYPAFSFIERAGITDPSQIAAINQLVLSAKEHEWWDKCDLIYPFVGGTALAHSQNLKSSSFTITWNGAVTHNANGITGDAGTAYGNTGYIVASSGQATLNSASFSYYRRTAGLVGTSFCNARGASVAVQFGAGLVGGGISTRLNNGGITIATSQTGFNGASRISSASILYYFGGLNSVVSASSTIPPVSFYILASNQNGVTTGFTSANLAGVTVGSGLSGNELALMASDWQIFQTALGRQA